MGGQSKPEDADRSANEQPDHRIPNRIIKVQARFQAQLDTATIQIGHLNFAAKLPLGHDTDTAITWDRIRNRYQNAVRINELGRKFGRVQPIISDLEKIANRYPESPIVHSHLAYFYTLVGDKRALVNYQKAATRSGDSSDWFNLAALALPDDLELSCYGLRRYFLLTAATENQSAWYVYLRMIRRASAYVNLSEYLQVPLRTISDSEARLVFETGIYLLKTTGHERIAEQAMSRWLTGDPPIDLALWAFQHLDRTPNERYRQVTTRIESLVATRRTPISNSAGRQPSIDSGPSSDPSDGLPLGRYRSISTDRQPNHDVTPRWEHFYRDAALANTEGRIEDARRLFRRAVSAGGGAQVHEAFFKMEWGNGMRDQARSIIRKAIDRFPETTTFFNLYGQSERRVRQYEAAVDVFRQGIARHPDDAQLRMGLAQSLVQLGTEKTLQEAGSIFRSLDSDGKLHTRDNLYQRYTILKHNPRANEALEFFQSAGMRTGLARQRDDSPPSIVDIVVDIEQAELGESFGLSGSFLVRCFKARPSPVHLADIAKYLQSMDPQDESILQTGRRVMLDPSLAFISVPNANEVRDQVMRILGDNQAAVIPLDDAFLRNRNEPIQSIQELLANYLSRRDLYNSTQPVSGRRFFGRENLLVALGSALDGGEFVGIFGLRKIGKTSLVYQLRDERLRHDAVAYVDLQASLALSTKNSDALYWEIERALYSRLSPINRRAASLLRLGIVDQFSRLPDSGVKAPMVFNEDLRALLDAVVAGRSGNIRRVVVFLDELEQILPIAGQEGIVGYLEFFGLLRGLLQTYQGTLSCAVVAANAAISESGYWEGRENPMYALFRPFFVPSLPEGDCEKMIRILGRGMSVYWDPAATSAVFSATAGHPFLTRMLCSYIAQRQSKRPLHVTRRMVEEHISPFIRDQGNLLEQITKLMKTYFPEEERVLEQIALGESAGGATDESIRHLLNYHLVVVEDGNYRIALNLLHRWLRRRAGWRA